MFKKKTDDSAKYLRQLSPETISITYDPLAGLLAFYIAVLLQPSGIFAKVDSSFLFKLAFFYALSVLGVGLFLHTHREAWGKASVTFISRLIFKLLVVTALYYPLMHLMSQDKGIPWTLPIHNMLILGVLIGLPRFIQTLRQRSSLPKIIGYERNMKLSVMIVGADHAAHEFIEQAKERMTHYALMGAISISSDIKIQDILGVPVLGSIEGLEAIFEKLTVEESLPKRIILVEQFMMSPQIKHVLQVAALFQVPVLVGTCSHSGILPISLRTLQLEDLIQYGSRLQDNYEMKGYIQGKKILITSACEFLMEEISTLIADFGAKHIILEDSFVMGLGALKTKLSMLYPNMQIDCVPRSHNQDYWSKLLIEFNPDLIFYSTLSTHALDNASAILAEVMRICDFIAATVRLKSSKIVIVSQSYFDKEIDLISLVDRFIVEYTQYVNYGQPDTRFISIQLENNVAHQEFLLEGLKGQYQQSNLIRVPMLSNACYFASKKEITRLILEVASGENENESAHQKAFVIDQVNPTYLNQLMEQSVLASGRMPYVDVEIEPFDSPSQWQFNGGFHQGLLLKSISLSSKFEWLPEILVLCEQSNFIEAEHLFKAHYTNQMQSAHAA